MDDVTAAAGIDDDKRREQKSTQNLTVSWKMAPAFTGQLLTRAKLKAIVGPQSAELKGSLKIDTYFSNDL